MIQKMQTINLFESVRTVVWPKTVSLGVAVLETTGDRRQFKQRAYEIDSFCTFGALNLHYLRDFHCNVALLNSVDAAYQFTSSFPMEHDLIMDQTVHRRQSTVCESHPSQNRQW